MNSPKQFVRLGYDRASHTYAEHYCPSLAPRYLDWLYGLEALLTDNARVLDLGCGSGVPVARHLARRFRVTGVDISPVQIEHARKAVPNAEFVCEDMTQLNLPPHHFAAIVALYSLIHVPLEEQRVLLARIAAWLTLSGHLLITVGETAWTGTEENWLGVLGVTMYWSHVDAATYRRWLIDLGFSILWEEFVPEGDSGHRVIFAQLVDPVAS